MTLQGIIRPPLDGTELARVDYLAWRLADYRGDEIVPDDDFGRWLWLAHALADWTTPGRPGPHAPTGPDRSRRQE